MDGREAEVGLLAQAGSCWTEALRAERLGLEGSHQAEWSCGGC